MITILSEKPSFVTHCLHELRDENLQKDRRRFETNIELMGLVLGYELSKSLEYKDNVTQTPLGTANTPVLRDQLVLATILRAGLPLQRGLQAILHCAEPAFVGAARKPETETTVEINLSYVAAPDLTGKVLILADTMLATGRSFVRAYQELIRRNGAPNRVFLVAVLASSDGAQYVQQQIPEADLLACAIDDELNDKFFIVPGLGDAGDLLYGPKI